MREQDLYQDMLKYRTGSDEQGNSLFSVPLELDEEGFLGRECPNASCTPRYFKVQAAEDPEDNSISSATIGCPYCGTRESFQEFHTQAQIDWVTSMVVRDVELGMVRALKKTFAPLNRRRGGLVNLRVDVNASPLPPLRKYVEEKLKQSCTCSSCSCKYAVYGIAFHCPLCGEGALLGHLKESAATVRVLVQESEAIGKKHGKAVEDRMLGSVVKDLVSIFEGFLKQLYNHEIRKRFIPEDAERLIGQVRTNMQRLSGAEELYRRNLGFGLFSVLSEDELQTLETVFLKRNVITHNLGLVDKKYRQQAQAWEKEGQEVSLSAAELEQALELIERTVAAAAVAAKSQTIP